MARERARAGERLARAADEDAKLAALEAARSAASRQLEEDRAEATSAGLPGDPVKLSQQLEGKNVESLLIQLIWNLEYILNTLNDLVAFYGLSAVLSGSCVEGMLRKNQDCSAEN